MNARAEIHGQELIGRPGQNLTAHELFVLVGLAEGIPSQVLAERTHTDAADLRQVEARIQAKLGARNKVHMVTRGFTLGVLIPNALCVLLCIISVLELEQDVLRPRTQRRTRSGGEITRLVRTTPATAGSGAARQILFA